jgi:hypothetical protein
MYTFSSKLKTFFLHLNGCRSLELDMVLTAPKDIQEVENYLLKAIWHGKLNMRLATVAHALQPKHAKVAKLRCRRCEADSVKC